LGTQKLLFINKVLVSVRATIVVDKTEILYCQGWGFIKSKIFVENVDLEEG